MVKQSWPSTVFIHFDYKFNSFKQNKKRIEFKSSYCSGTLIDPNTVLTTARCIIKKVFSSNEKTFKKVEPNDYHLTIASTYKLYFGVHDMSNILNEDPKREVVVVQASDIFVVNFSNLIFFKAILKYFFKASRL